MEEDDSRPIISIAINRLGRVPRFSARSVFASPIFWYWNRLRCMSVAEVAYRLKQKITIQAQQLGFGIVAEVPQPNFLRSSTSQWLALQPGVDGARCIEAANLVLEGRLRVFDLETAYGGLPEWNRDPRTRRQAPLDFGKTLNYRDEEQVGDVKYLWEPNRHLHLVTVAQAYQLTGDVRYAIGLRRLLTSWFMQCPYLRGPNWTSSLELGIRLINWSLIWQLIGGRDSFLFSGSEGKEFLREWLESIYRHMHFIAGHFSRFSSANNHLIGEAAGLYIGAATWRCWQKTNLWREHARAILVREALRQNASDGVNREQAIAYQQFVLDFLLLAGLMGRADDNPFPEAYWTRIERMLEFIAALLDAGDHLPMIGDGDDGFVVALSPDPSFCPYRSLLATGAVLFNRPAFKRKAGVFDDKSGWLLGKDGETKYAQLPCAARKPLPRAFPEGGYWILGKDLGCPTEIRVVVDAGPLGHERIAAHGHADALAFTLSVAGREILIDPGTYAYHTERVWRDYFRGTAAHNTARVDQEDQSVKGGPFMWLRHARARCTAWRPGEDRDLFIGTHDGYTRLQDPVIHERQLVFDKPGECIQVVDTLHCAAKHLIERCWHFAEDVEVRIGSLGELDVRDGRIRVRFLPDEPVDLELYRGSETPPFGWVSRRFGVKTPTTTAVWRNRIRGHARLTAKVVVERQEH